MKRTSSDLILLDINVLLALAWPNHQFHAVASERLEAGERWATCALTELGFIRLSSNPAVIPNAVSATEAAGLLAAMVEDSRHVFLERLPSPARDSSVFRAVLGNRQVTDAYLLALARRNRAGFLTFDKRLRELAGAETRTEILGLPT